MTTRFTFLVLTILLATALVMQTRRAHAHDWYTKLVQLIDPYPGLHHPKTGRLCCGGDPVTGDCEAIQDYTMLPNGDAIFESRRYGASVKVARDMIAMQAVAGSRDPVHWCGTKNSVEQKLTPQQADGQYVTICAFIDPGGA